VSVVTIDRPPRPKPEDVTAAEFALGLLDGEDRSRALRRLLAEPAFAADVELWQAHFGGLFETWPEVTPPIDGAARLMRAIAPFAANDADPVTVTNLPLLRWQGIAGLSSALQRRPESTSIWVMLWWRRTMSMTQLLPIAKH